VNYELKLPLKWKIHNRFHASLLTPVVENTIYGKHNPRPQPILVSGEEEYEIEAILNHKTQRLRSGVKNQYLVRWQGYGPTEDSWELEANLEHSKEVLNEYKRRHNIS